MDFFDDFHSNVLLEKRRLFFFFFLITVEGLTSLVQKTFEYEMFNNYKVHKHISFNILQFADVPILLGKGTLNNLLNIKLC